MQNVIALVRWLYLASTFSSINLENDYFEILYSNWTAPWQSLVGNLVKAGEMTSPTPYATISENWKKNKIEDSFKPDYFLGF